MPEISPARYRAGEGEPLVLIHGFTATWRCWLPVLPELVARYDVLAPTLTGHDGGPEAGKDAPHDLQAAGDHLEQELDAQGIETAHLVGNSLGGALALELAKRGRARSVVALAPGGGWHPGDPEGERLVRFFTRQLKMARMAAPRAGRIMARPGTRRIAFRDVMCHGEQMPPAEAVAMLRSSLRCTVVEDAFEAIRSGKGVMTDLGRIACPVLVAWPEKDRILPMAKHSPRFRAEIAGVEYRVLPRIGHLPMWDDPALVGHTITEFVEGAATAAATPAAA
ncbi:MAG TPA: alpha/beta hydrolase [Thermoleophilaceae bacterium]|nr:alpha/beta hydrolase [Thermoleophilaceae bacterium]